MDILHDELELSFPTKEQATEFIQKMKQEAYKYDVITVIDVLKHHGLPLISGGFDWGYSKAMIKKLKARKNENDFPKWIVTFPKPGKLVRDKNGYWTVETESGG